MTVLDYIVGLLEEITAELGDVDVTPDMMFGDLGIESINLVYLLAEVQQHFGLGGALIDRLRAQRIDVRFLRADQLAEVVEAVAARASSKEAAR